MRLLNRIQLHCRHAPDRPAIVDEAGTTSYGALWRGARRFSERLGAGPGDTVPAPVAVCMPKSARTVAAFLACWMNGAPYIPVMPGIPRERMAHMLQAAGVKYVCVEPAVSDEDFAFHEWLLGRGVTIVVADRTAFEPGGPASGAAAIDDPWTPSDNPPEAVAAILFTSGSTGAPKAAQITFGNLEHFVAWVHQAFDLGADDQLASHAPFQFDLSFLDVFATLTCGATVHLLPEHMAGSGRAMAQWMNGHAITIWQSVPSALGLVAQAGVGVPGVRCVLFAGERMPHARLMALHAVFSTATFYNIYGCTETNNTFMYTVPAAQEEIPDPLPIGKPLPDTRYRVLDAQMNRVAPGDSGVLWVSTPTLMRGYLDGQRTAEAIRVMKDEDGRDRRYYLTNDVVRELPSGDVDYLGRNDWVLKTSGYRVSLQEIEAAIDLHQGIAEVGVVGVPDADLGNRLVAVVRPRRGTTLTTLQLKLHCGRCLPRYMIPHQFLFRDDDLPKNVNGKLDRRRLQHELAAQRA